MKNRFLEESPAMGYRDVLVNLALPQVGVVVELQLTLRNLAELKRSMHPFYKVLRSKLPAELLSQAIFRDFQVGKEGGRGVGLDHGEGGPAGAATGN